MNKRTNVSLCPCVKNPAASCLCVFFCRQQRVLCFCLRMKTFLRSELRTRTCISSLLAAKVLAFKLNIWFVSLRISCHLHLPFSFIGVLRVWEASTGRCVYTQTLAAGLNKKEEEEEEKEDDPRSLMYLLHLPVSSRLATVTAEHNILLYQLPGLTTMQQVGSEDTHGRG